MTSVKITATTIGQVNSGKYITINGDSRISLNELATELNKLRQTMKVNAVEPEHDIAVSEIAKAEQAAKNNDTSKVNDYLKSAGSWALGIAKEIGVPIAAEAIKNALSIS